MTSLVVLLLLVFVRNASALRFLLNKLGRVRVRVFFGDTLGLALLVYFVFTVEVSRSCLGNDRLISLAILKAIEHIATTTALVLLAHASRLGSLLELFGDAHQLVLLALNFPRVVMRIGQEVGCQRLVLLFFQGSLLFLILVSGFTDL